MAVLTVDDLERILRVEFTDDAVDQVEEIIADVQGELEMYLGQPLDIVEVIGERHLLGYQSQQIFLDKTPVVSIDSVAVNDVEITSPIWQVNRWGIDLGSVSALAMADPVIWTPSAYAYSSVPPDVYALATGTIPESVYTVDYHAGLDGAQIRAVKSIMTRAVRRELASVGEGLFGAGEYTRISVEDYSVQKSERMMMMKVGPFFEGELKSVALLRRKRIAS